MGESSKKKGSYVKVILSIKKLGHHKVLSLSAVVFHYIPLSCPPTVNDDTIISQAHLSIHAVPIDLRPGALSFSRSCLCRSFRTIVIKGNYNADGKMVSQGNVCKANMNGEVVVRSYVYWGR